MSSTNTRRQRSLPAHFNDFIVDFQFSELENKTSSTNCKPESKNVNPSVFPETISCTGTNENTYSTRHTRFLSRLKTDSERYAEFRRHQNERNRMDRKKLLTKPLATVEAYKEKARRRSAKNLDTLRQTPELYQQYLNKKRDEKRRRRATLGKKTYSKNKQEDQTISFVAGAMIKKEELKIEPNPGTDDPSFFVKTENIEDDPFFKMYKIENTEDLKYPKSTSPKPVVIKQEKELDIDDSYV